MKAHISREYWFSAAHRLIGHPKCGRLHGHNYRVVVHLHGKVHENGMVVDYAEMDRVLKPLVDYYDHRYLVSESELNDPLVAAMSKTDKALLACETSTAENLAREILAEAQPALGCVASVEVQEAPRSSAVVYREEIEDD